VIKKLNAIGGSFYYILKVAFIIFS